MPPQPSAGASGRAAFAPRPGAASLAGLEPDCRDLGRRRSRLRLNRPWPWLTRRAEIAAGRGQSQGADSGDDRKRGCGGIVAEREGTGPAGGEQMAD